MITILRRMATSRTAASIASKFEGALLGSLIGDCMGEPFESAEIPVPLAAARVAKFFSSVRDGKKKSNSLCYTDDTAMMKEVATCLVLDASIDHKHLAQKLTSLYFAEPDRGYGLHVGFVFDALRHNPSDVLKPAREQFNGTGSYGNGAAMRVCPVGLFFYNDEDRLIQAAHDSSLVTHTHRNGYNGAILQALAVAQAVRANPSVPLDALSFVQELKNKMSQVEKDGVAIYTDQLKKMEELLKQTPAPSVVEVVKQLGNNVSALKSVPTAIYSFLVGANPLEGFEGIDAFERTIQYAIGLGGDTDTIACMAGGICGAHLGVDAIPEHLVVPCEGVANIKQLAQQLYQASIKR